MNMHPHYPPHSLWTAVLNLTWAIELAGFTTSTEHELAEIAERLALWPDPRLRDMGRLLRAIGQALEGLEDMAPGPVAADIDWDREPLREEILVSDDGTPP
jgi:hypothetical protein